MDRRNSVELYLGLRARRVAAGLRALRSRQLSGAIARPDAGLHRHGAVDTCAGVGSWIFLLGMAVGSGQTFGNAHRRGGKAVDGDLYAAESTAHRRHIPACNL